MKPAGRIITDWLFRPFSVHRFFGSVERVSAERGVSPGLSPPPGERVGWRSKPGLPVPPARPVYLFSKNTLYFFFSREKT